MDTVIISVEEKEIFTVNEAARYLTVSPRFVYGLIHSNQLKAIMVGKRYKVTAESLLQYIARNRIK